MPLENLRTAAIYGGSSPKKGIPLCHLWRLKPEERDTFMPFMAAQARRKGYLYAIYGGSSLMKGIS
ncbi:MAG: hypothetical protein D4R67_00585, partial [Bacteroidetes bacterium]